MLDIHRNWNDLVRSLLNYVPEGEIAEWTLKLLLLTGLVSKTKVRSPWAILALLCYRMRLRARRSLSRMQVC